MDTSPTGGFDLETVIRYPMESDDWLKTIAIGGVLIVFSFLIVPAIAVYGYLITAISDSLEGRPEPPGFQDWGGLLRKGVLGWVIGLVYMIVPIVIGAVTVGGSLMAMAGGSQAGQAAGLAGMVGGFGLSLVLSLAFGYVAIIAVVNFARTDEFGSAFDFDTIRQVALDRSYLVAWLASVAVFVAAIVVGSVLNVVPLLGAIASAFVFFYAEVVAANLWATGFAAATEESAAHATSVTGSTV